MRPDLPSGTVTFLFSDVEGSTRLLGQLGATAYADALLEHRRVIREAATARGGVEVDTQGDALFIAFPTAAGAMGAAAVAMDRLASGPIRVRMGIHTGTPHLGSEGYVGHDVHKGARIAAAGHGGQVLISSTTVALVGTAGLRDLGEHRLKDLSGPERIWQLGDREFPRIRSLHQTNLPVAPTPFVGRDRELGEVVALLGREDGRVLTLTGPGGSGKTRLAMQVAADASDRYPHGVWWIPLDALRHPDLVLESAAHALGATTGLAEHISDKAVLVVFDNFEHLMGAAGPLAQLMSACPRLDVLVTSREPLRIRGEREYPVPPLPRDESVRLFSERALTLGRDVGPADVGRICAALDDLPLAIELAAARTRVLSTGQILARLEQRLPLLTAGARDVPERQRTLRATIAWSYELLRPEEQRLFARLSVFRGGWTLETAEAVAEADLDVMQSLVEKSLVRHTGERFSMLQTIREFAAERLEGSGEAGVIRDRHAEHFFALALEHEPVVLRAGDPRSALDRLDSEHDDLRTAIDRLTAAGDTDRAMRLAGALFEFWCERGHAREGYQRLSSLLRADARPSPGRLKVLLGAAHLAANAGVDDVTQRQLAEGSVQLARSVGDEWDRAFADLELAHVTATDGDFARALPAYEEAVRRFHELGDTHRELMAMRSLGWAADNLGDRARYKQIVEEILRRARAAGERRMELVVMGALAWVATTEGRTDDALALLKDSAYRLRDSASRAQLALIVARAALAHATAGRAEIAARLLGRSEEMREEMGVTDPEWVIEQKRSALEMVSAALDEAALARATAAGKAMTVDDALVLAFGEGA